MKQVDVTIMGQGYRLGCPDGGEQTLHAAVTAVDREMCAIRDGGRVKARERIAVLAALNLAYSLAEQRSAAQHQASTADLQALLRRIDQALAADDLAAP